MADDKPTGDKVEEKPQPVVEKTAPAPAAPKKGPVWGKGEDGKRKAE